MVGETDSFIIDERNRIAIVKTYGIGGGFGMSAGIGTSSGSGRKDVKTMEGTSVKIGASIHGIGFEMDDKAVIQQVLGKLNLAEIFMQQSTTLL